MSDQSPLPRVVLSARMETTFDYAIEAVWPYMIHWGSWIDDFVAHHVAGTPESVGEVRRISSFDESGRLARSFCHEVIKFDPPNQFVYKMRSPLSEYDARTGQITEIPVIEYDINTLIDVGGKTLYSCDVVGEYRSPTILTEEQAHAAAEAYRVNGVKTWAEKYFPAVKKLMAQELG
jgi:hypothetical protein